jgi:SAM-dependent methyltransferase
LYLPSREERFAAMLDVLGALLPKKFRALDLASGPGAISERILRRFPSARCVAVDFDPVMLRLGREVLGSAGGRLDWVEADLRTRSWTEQLPPGRFDAVLSTTALHWLPGPDLVRVYHDIGRLLRPGGLFLDGDHLAFERSSRRLRALAHKMRQKAKALAAREPDREDWRSWWQAIRRDPALADSMEERDRRFPHEHDLEEELTRDFHDVALRAAGFREVQVIWRQYENCVLLGIR